MIESIKVSENLIGINVIENERTMLTVNDNSQSVGRQLEINQPSTSKSTQQFSKFNTATEILQSHKQGPFLIDAIKNQTFSERDRRALVRIVVSSLTDYYGSFYPPTAAKIALARGIVEEFPSLKDDHSVDGFEHFYDCETGYGFIEDRLLNLRKSLSA